MLIAPAKGPESATRPDPGTFDAALVVVHGMGNAFKSQILLEWAEPLLERMDWVARDRIIGADETHGVTIHDSDLSGDTPIVTATVRFPKHRDPDDPDAAVETVERRIAILEARWSESFVPMTRAQVFRWSVPFMWRAITRTLGLFWNTMVVLSWLTLGHHLRAPRETLLLPRWLNLIVDLIRVAVSTIAFLVVWTFLVLVGVVMTPILPLLSPLLLIPWFKNVAQGVLDQLVESIGDVATWKERPVRASAMRLVVRDALGRAKELVGDDGDVHLFAHSQGAAVATFALFEELDPAELNVRRLTTVGAAVVLLGREKWQGRKDTYTPVKTWIERNAANLREGKPHVAWSNHWAIWDPFSAGPITDTKDAARKRWQAAYFPSAGTLALGPEEHAVHNTSQPWLDHGVYYANTVQVVEPTVRHLLGDEFPPVPQPVEYIRNRLIVIDKKSLGLSTIAAFLIAAILPGLSGASAFIAWLVQAVADGIGWVISLVPGLDGSGASAAVAFLIDQSSTPPRLSTIGWIVASALVAALLVWLNQLMQKQTERSIVWDRCPLDVRTWLVLTAIPRALYVLGAAVVVWFAILDWWEPQPSTGWLVVWAVILAAVAGFVIVEPRFSPAPRIVPEQETLEATPRIVPPPEPMRLGIAIASEEYRRELAARRANLQPEGAWATWWAKHFHGWTPDAKPAASDTTVI